MSRTTVRARLARAYRRYVPVGSRAALRQARARYLKKGHDVVSVVIPVYNVEEYLAECLGSVVRQTYRAIEVIVVDDGSPDGSYEIARSYEQADPRVRIVRRPNGGLGAARNTGVAEAHGRYVCFLDSDDMLPRDAIERMVRSLRASGSDFVVGAHRRLRGDRTWTPEWVQQVFTHNRTGITVDEFPEMLKSIVATDKLFDTAFFRRAVGKFPEGIRYEDQEPAAKAFVTGTFDMVPSPVYDWRVREDRTSISQQKSDPANLRDRLLVANRVADVISRGVNQTTYDMWLAKSIGWDLRGHFQQVPRTDVEFFETLRDGVQKFSERMSPDVWQQVPIVDRILALAVLAGFREDVTTAVCRRDEHGLFVPAELREGGAVLARSYLEGMRLDPSDEQLRLAPDDLRLTAKAVSLWWHDGTLRLAGHAYITNLPYDPEIASTEIALVSGDHRVPLPVRNVRDDRIDIETKDAWNPHRESGFAVDIDPAELSSGVTDPWQVEVTVTVAHVKRTAVLHDREVRGIAGTQPVARAQGGCRWVAGFENDGPLQIRHTTELGSPIRKLSSDGASVSMTVDDAWATVLHLGCRSLRREFDVKGRRDPETGQVSFDITLPDLGGADDLTRQHYWSLQLHGGSEDPRAVTYPGSADDLGHDSDEHGAVRLVMDGEGTVRLAQNRWRAIAEDVRIDSETLTVTGRVSAKGATAISGSMVVESQVIEADQATMDTAAESFEVRFPFNTGGTAPTTRQGFSVRLSVHLDGEWQERWLTVSQDLQHRFPYDAEAGRYGMTLSRTRKLAGLWVRFRHPHLPDERGRLARRRLVDHFRTPVADGGGAEPELRDAVLFESFFGRNISDSVLAMYDELRGRELGLEFFWTVADMNVQVPEGATRLLIGSRAYMDVLSNARYLVNNSNFPYYFRKRAGQTYVQTWHGSPLKRIGNDVPPANLALSYRTLMHREAEYWDFLLAQNDFAADMLPKAFGYHGRVLNLGYPRNDALVDAEAPVRRKRVRADWGIRDDQKAILYAPTWRDNVSVSTGWGMVSHLDFDAAQSTAGEDTVFLLRGHVNTAHQVLEQPDGVIDVTRHPDVNDVLLAADLLVTDYSSIMFDFAATGKPMAFLTPDLEQYRDVTRGFYLDFEEIAPGPIYRSSAELVNALAGSIWTDVAACAGRYNEFVTRFVSRDDGEATRRVVDEVWG